MFKKIITKIEEYKKIIIHVHFNADGDCTGSAMGLKDIIKTSFEDKEVYIVGKEADYLKFLGDFDKIEDSVYEGALCIVLDTAVKKRVQDLRFELGEYIIKIDHHQAVEEFGDIEYVDVNCSSTAEILMQMYLENQDKLSITNTGLRGLYTGIITDTGGLRHKGITSKTFNIVGHIIDSGVDYTSVHEELAKTSENSIRFKGNLLLNYEQTENGFTYFVITKGMMDEYQVTREEAVSLVNELSRFENSPVWAIICENPETGQYRVRLRSKGPYIDEFAGKYNGGGHNLASGATIESADLIEAFIKDVDNLVKEYKSNK